MLVLKIKPSPAALAAIILAAATAGCSAAHHEAVGQDNGALNSNLLVATSYGSAPAHHPNLTPPSTARINHHDIAPAAR